MKTKLKTESKFIVNPENRVVICVMDVDAQLHEFKSWYMVDYDDWKVKAPMVKNSYGKFTVKATARCNPNDTFNETIGKRIAESRAKVKAFRIAKNIWSCITKKLFNEYNISMEMYENCKAMEKFESNHVKELSE